MFRGRYPSAVTACMTELVYEIGEGIGDFS